MSIAEKFETIADAVYQKGYEDGAGNNTGDSYDKGYTDGYEKGRDDEYNAFWKTYQNNGNATSYAYAFYGSTWTDALYKPLKQIDGVDITFKVYNTCNGMYQGTYITDTLIPIDISGENVSSNTTYMFYTATRLKKINKLIVKESNVFSSAFGYCRALTDIEIEGTIGRSISFADCPLTVESMKNVIEHLKDYSEDETNRGKYTITFSDSCWRNLEASGAAEDGDTWENYVIKLGWLIG